MEDITFTGYQPEFNAELNTWQTKENMAGSNGLNQFVVTEGTMLGDYLEFVDSEMPDITTRLAFDQENLVGFLCYSTPEENHTHIEIMGVNPDCRGKGYSPRMLDSFKKSLQETSQDPQNLTLSVNKANLAGIASFSKVARIAEKQDKENYIHFEL
ncbi:MAG: GNAT family N-acetyltransferase [Clostridia bacterium]|nr:GNAT family N-acetyltransferase [Clostridia bacterium]